MKIRREVKIGLFAVVMLVCLYLGVNYLKGEDVFSSDRVYYALFDQTRGLQTSAPVLLRGVKVGAVTGISLDGAHPDKVVVKVGVKRSVNIPSDSRLKLFSNGLMGERAIELVMGSAGSHFESDAVIPSEIEGGLLENASLGIEELVAEAKVAMNSLEETSNTLNGILAENAGSFKGVMTGLSSTMQQISDAEIGVMLSDLGHFSAMLKNNSERLDGIIGNLDEVAVSLVEADLRATLDTLGMSIASMNVVLAKLSDGDGTLGRLLDDPALYDSLTVAAADLDALLTDLKANPKRYVHFSLFGGGNKEKKKR